MTITTSSIVTEDRRLLVNGKVIFTGVPENVTVTPASSGSAFVGASSLTPASRHVFSLGSFQGFNFVSLFRYKIWWMIPRFGSSGSEVLTETQMLLLEVKEESAVSDEAFESPSSDTFYVLVLPVLEGPFRASLQGTPSNELQFCVESGDPDVQTTQVSESVFINSGENPYELMKNSIRILAAHKGTFSHLENKKMPAHLDWFGWCTWDAFYQDVNPEGIIESLESFSEGGCVPRFLIIDDGWQDTVNEIQKEGEEHIEGTQFATRLRSIRENNKFCHLSSNDYTTLPEFIKFIKEKYDLKYVYMWHALVGYWGGLLPSSEAMKKYNPRLVYPVQSPGNVGNIRDVAMDNSIEKYGIGLIDPDKICDFYNDYHSYLASIDVDGVKVDVQNVVETIGPEYGGRVHLTSLHQRALEESVTRNFKNNNLICCMSHNSDSIFSSQKSAVARASEDFMPKEPTLQTLHIASVSFNSLLLGEIVVPDWDMFHSKHDAADFHAASRAVGGCAVYVSVHTSSMAIFIEDNSLFVNGNVVLTGVPKNIVISTAPSGSAFLGASSLTPSSRHVFTLGTFEGFNFLSLFRFKIWWMTPKIGTSGSDIRIETQLLLIEAEEKFVLVDNDNKLSTDRFYILVLPVLEGAFRASLQGTETNELQFCVESGDSDVQITQVCESVFINSGDNPYELIRNSVKILAAHKGTFSHLDDKKLPVHLDWFGWCTWDAFYKDVNPEGIRQGFESLSQGGYAPRFLVLDEGWQDTFNEFQNEDESTDFGFETRLKDFKENDKFRNLSSDEYTTLAEFIKFLKERYDLKYVYVWHAILGCWGGVLPSSEALEKYKPELVHPIQSPGNLGNLRDIAMDGIEKYGMGVINPEMISDFYSDYHSYIASIGVDGVKVDIQNVLETIGSGYGGRVRMTAMYQRGLEESVARNFENNNLICSMSHDSDLLFSSKKSAVIRSYEDFMPREQLLQTVHIAAVSFNCLFLGELGVADWDMFQSLHYAADFHAASRAVGGCAVYVSDKPGNHDFNILKRLVLPDGSIMRARYAGRPTRDCLFKDPVMDGKTLLKIWNLNKLSGIVGVFNCQGGGAWPWVHNLEDNSTPEIISSKVSPKDVEFLEDVAGDLWQGDCVVYAFYSGSLNKISKSGHLEVSLRILKCELFTVCPVRVFNEAVHFAPIGLLDMYNSGGAVEKLSSDVGPDGCIVKMKVRGCGRFGAYSTQKPRYCTVDTKREDFAFSSEDGLITMNLEGGCQQKDIDLVF